MSRRMPSVRTECTEIASNICTNIIAASDPTHGIRRRGFMYTYPANGIGCRDSGCAYPANEIGQPACRTSIPASKNGRFANRTSIMVLLDITIKNNCCDIWMFAE